MLPEGRTIRPLRLQMADGRREWELDGLRPSGADRKGAPESRCDRFRGGSNQDGSLQEAKARAARAVVQVRRSRGRPPLLRPLRSGRNRYMVRYQPRGPAHQRFRDRSRITDLLSILSSKRKDGMKLTISFLLLCSLSFAQAPPRSRPYAEAAVASNPNVFFVEDFEGQDIVNYGGNNCNSTWDNPALEREDICWAGGGSHQRSTIPLAGFDQATNRVWRISKTQSFVDINTGINTGTGNGTIAGFLRPEILGTGAREWYTRMNVYFSPTHTWPADLDFKMFFALPRSFIDPPSAAYEAGMYFQQDFWCSGSGNYNDVPCLRYSSNFQSFPYQNEYCPPLAPGLAPNGTQAPRFVRNRWYTLESHFRLAQNNTGILQLWVDGVLAYSTNRATCPSWACPDMGYIMILGWMNSSDPQSGYYEVDNIVMSRSYIGPPTGGEPPPPPPAACSDTLDNDSDGLIDYPADPGCSSAADTDETNAPPPPPPPQYTLNVAKTVSRCSFVLSANPPDATGGWTARFYRSGNINVGNPDSTAPFTRTVELTTGSQTFTVVFSKSGVASVTYPSVSATCP